MRAMKQSNAVGSLKYVLAPIFVLIVVSVLIFAASEITLPEKLQTYETFFLILTAIVALFFMAICLPCSLYGGYLAVVSIVRDRKYVLPVIALLLDCAVLFAWVYALQHFF